jgi:hypothetical protein
MRQVIDSGGDKLIPIPEPSPGIFTGKFSMPIPNEIVPAPGQVSPKSSGARTILATNSRVSTLDTHFVHENFHREKIQPGMEKQLTKSREEIKPIGMIPKIEAQHNITTAQQYPPAARCSADVPFHRRDVALL